MAKTSWFSIGASIRNGVLRLFFPRALAKRLAQARSTGFKKYTTREIVFTLLFCSTIGIFIILVIVNMISGSSPNSGMAADRRSPPEHSAQAKAEVDATPVKSAEDPQDLSWDIAQRNFQGQAHDGFVCSTFEDRPFVSFDSGRFWWKDDGRCAEHLLKEQRDEDAHVSSYWPTTVRVDTDMDSFWLPDEERTCQTFPDDKGRVATVSCDARVHANHNIPVKFWGGVDRHAVSDWTCLREGDGFVCRAID